MQAAPQSEREGPGYESGGTANLPSASEGFRHVLTLSEESNGEYTLLEIELAPGGGNEPHFHRAFAERFEVLEGELTVQIGDKKAKLGKGESMTAPANSLHSFSNPTDSITRFRVELRPGHTGFENSLRIMYGLARDGLTNAKGVPRSLGHIAILAEMSDTNLPGVLSWLQPVLKWLAGRARRRGIERDLLDRYCSSWTV